MVRISLIENKYSIGDNLGDETIIKEYKEYYLIKSLNLYDVDDLKNGIISDNVKSIIYKSILYYISKYFDRYLLSLTNISKMYLPFLLDKTHSKIFIGVSDKGNITGIPLNDDQIKYLEIELVNKVTEYYKNIMGLHNNKKDIEIKIGDKIYYNYDKLINILRKHTHINIHKIKNERNKNKDCISLLNKIDDIKKDEKLYLEELKKYTILFNKKIEYNNQYSVPFYLLIRAEKVMNEFKSYTSIISEDFDNILNILKEKITIRKDVEKYLLNGLYIENSLFPDNIVKDIKYDKIVSIFLEEYKYFKIIQLRKNINLPRFKMKNPVKQIYPLLNNISIFNEYLDMDYCMIEIKVPFIKDINVYIASKKNNKILERGYSHNIDGPCTIG
jgi:hypothetical protein